MKPKKLIVLFIIFIMFFTTINFSTVCFADNSNSEKLHIYSHAAILMENKTGKILYEKNSEKKMYPASTTKILSAIIAIEKANLNDKLTVSHSAIADMKSGYTTAYLTAGEVISVKDLLKVLLLHSANEASNVLAEHISGSISKFVDLMNQKAKELGCTNTHFVTTNGLHDDNHYTTAKDLAIIARYCMQNSTFRKIVSSSRCKIPATNKSDIRSYRNTNGMVDPTSAYYYPGCVGIKTGYTSQAQNCLVSAVNKNGLQLIAVVLGAGVTENRKSARYVDSKTLYDYGYSNYTFKKIANKSDILKTIEVKDATEETKSLDLILENDVSALVNKNSTTQVVIPEITLNSEVSAPIAQNAVVGTATFNVDGKSYTQKLLASHDVQQAILNETTINFLGIALGLLILIIILVIILIILLNKNKKNKKA